VTVLVNTVTVVIVGLGMSYFVLTMAAGVLYSRRPRYQPAHAVESAQPSTVFFLIACLDEELVIGETVRRLVTDPRARVVVVDDGSEDRTGAIAAEAGTQVVVVRRQLPDARRGKGPALNHGFARIRHLVAAERIDPDAVLVCVMDADGHLSEHCLDHVLPLFRDPDVGGAQLPVRIRNRHLLLGLVQDLEFWGLSATSQLGRIETGTVSLGGNGQFTRFSALVALEADPWSSSLTEDLDLTLTLLARGWRLTSTDLAHVDQQGVERLRPLIRQRTRWMQGHMTCGRRLPEVWRSPRLTHAAVLEVTAYLAVPWVLVLPWSILFHVGIWQTVQVFRGHGWAVFGRSTAARAVGVVLWYGLSFFPSLTSGYLYLRRARGFGIVRSLALGHLLIPANHIAYAAAWRAAYRMVRGRTGWDKTRRAAEAAPPVGLAA
jgi:1,2-diacylglycerol 3-beta-glucosyltransferase